MSVSQSLCLCLCAVTSLAVGSYPPDDCGVSQWQIPAAPSGLQLRQVQAVIRWVIESTSYCQCVKWVCLCVCVMCVDTVTGLHGVETFAGREITLCGIVGWLVDRFPWQQMTCTAKCCHVYTEKVSEWVWSHDYWLYLSVYSFGDETLRGNCSQAQLTTIGWDQHRTNGQTLAKAYVDTQFLSKTLDPTELYLRSDGEALLLSISFVFTVYNDNFVTLQIFHGL